MQKSYHRRFSSFTVFHGQIIICILKRQSETAKLPSKDRIAVKTFGSTAMDYVWEEVGYKDALALENEQILRKHQLWLFA